MALSQINSNSIANNAIVVADIADGSVTSAKLEANIAITGNLTVDSTTLTVDSVNNRVGVGTASPLSQIHINSDSDNFFTAGLRVNRFDTPGQYASINYSSGSVNIVATDTVGSNPLILFRNSTNGSTATERMRIDGSGNVQIGSVGGAAKLNLFGDSPLRLYNLAGTNQSDLDITSAQILAIKTYHASGASITFGTNSSGGGNSERMRIDSGGRLGLGSSLTNTNNRAYFRSDNVNAITNVLMLNNGTADNQAGTGVRLLFSGVSESNSNIRYAYLESATASSGNDHYLAFGTNAATTTPVERMRIDSSGNVGIGTSTPTTFGYNRNLTISNSTSASLGLISGSNGFYVAITSSGGPLLNATNSQPMLFYTGDAERLRITATGRVGIGTTTPTTTLDVNGTINAPNESNFTVTSLTRASVRPSLLLDFANTETLDPRITFTRASSATYYDGKTVAKAEENLALYSQTFDPLVWNTDSVIVTTGQTAPNGTSTAIKIAAKTNNGQHYAGILGSMISALTLSVHVKAAGSNVVRIDGNTGLETAAFNLSTGTVSSTTGGVTATITNLGNGWYRLVVVLITPRTSFIIWPDANQGNYIGNGTDGILIWGAQAEQRSFVTAYTPTTTAPITNYIPVLLTAGNNVARFEHNPVTGESLGLEIEEQRSNLLLRSEEFDNTAWAKLDSSVTVNTVIAPDGTLTADKLVDTTANVLHYVIQSNVVISSNANYAYSVYVKAGEYSRVRIRYGRSATPFTRIGIIVNLSDGTFTNADVGTPTSVAGRSAIPVGNGWYRIVVAGIFDTTGTIAHTEVALINDAGNTTFAGNGYSGIYIWGAQLEAGSFATSYIPTVASQVTRSSDTASMTGSNFSSWYRTDEGTLYSDSTPTGQTNNGHMVFSFLGTADNIIASTQYLGGSSVRSLISTVNNSNQVLIAETSGANNKIAGAYKVNDFAASINGAAVSTDTSGAIPIVDKAYIGNFGANGQIFTGTIRKLSYYPKRLQNSELQALTTV